MESGTFMDQGAPAGEYSDGGVVHGPLAIATACEVVLIFSGILAYIWRWHHTSPHAWIALWALILLSHILHHDTLRGLGLTWNGLQASAQWVLPLAVLVYLPILFYGFLHHRLELLHPNLQSLLTLLGYGVWCLFQQYLMQSYFNNRLLIIVRNQHVSSILVAIMFSATHLPNPILMIATLVAGFVFAEVFARHRNLWPLALVQAVGGMLIAAVSPDVLIHHMRVGPGYYFYKVR
jgi:hypothetical protein